MSNIRISTDQATVGMMVANDIFARNNQLLAGKDTILTERSIIRLKLYGIKELEIKEQTPNSMFQTDEIEELPDQYNYVSEYYTEVRNTEEFKRFTVLISTSADSMKNYFNRIVEKNGHVDSTRLITILETIIKQSRNGIHLLDMINCMRIYDDTTFIHSINVALISYAIGRWMKLPMEEIRILSLAGLFHDIGKLAIPKNIVLKPSKLTDSEFLRMKDHVIYGYQILKNEKIDNRIKLTALMHHEKCDKSGYPMKLSGDQIEPFAKIVAIADVYDAMTSKRIYREPMCPFHVISELESDGLQKYDPSSLIIFLDRIVQSYIHNWVVLSNKEIAEIIMINKNSLSKPVVRTKDEHYIDLSKERDIKIMSFI